MKHFNNADVPSGHASRVVDMPADAAHISIDASRLFTADFSRDGSDLVLQTAGQPDLVIVDYFSHGPVDLVSPEGALLRADLVARLAGPMAPGQYAQAGAVPQTNPIGQVETLRGEVVAQRSDGTKVTLEVGSKVYQNDVIVTTEGAETSITFVDGTIFTLASASRMVLDDLVYQPGGTDNGATFSLVEGSFAFIAGEVAKTGGMEVNTPTATMGIRGTTVRVDITTVQGVTTVEVSLHRDPDGGLGRIELRDLDGNLIADITSSDTKWVVSPIEGETREVDRGTDDQAADAQILADAANAFALAYGRVASGDTFVNLDGGRSSLPTETQTSPPPPPNDTGSDEGQNGGDSQDSDPTDQPGPDGSNETLRQRPQDTQQAEQPQTAPTQPPPTVLAISDAATGSEDTEISGNLLENDPGGPTLTVTGNTDPANGTLDLSEDGAFIYTPAPDFNGIDSFTYTVRDGQGGTATATVTLTVTPVNDAPVAVDDAASGDEDTVLSGNVLANDSDVDLDPLTVTGNSNPANGTLILAASGGWTYTPAPDFNGTDSFTYTVSDGQGGTATATVALSVTAVNDAPVAVDDAVDTFEETPISINVLENDFDIETGVTLQSVENSTNGSAMILENGDILYTPDDEFDGIDSFTYTISDGQGGTATGTVTVTVAPDLSEDPGNDDDDILIGLAEDDLLSGGASNDLIDGGAGNDTLNGNAGDDSLFGGLGDDELNGGPGNDRLSGGPGADVLDGGVGDDILVYQGADDSFDGGAGRDTLLVFSGAGSDLLATLEGSNIEAIDLNNFAPDALDIAYSDVINLSPEPDTELDGLLAGIQDQSATIYGETGDSVALQSSPDGFWIDTGESVTDSTGATLGIYQFNGGTGVLATLGIDDDIAVTGAQPVA